VEVSSWTIKIFDVQQQAGDLARNAQQMRTAANDRVERQFYRSVEEFAKELERL
jgi:phage host-nuclease inhibitor protein Gam